MSGRTVLYGLLAVVATAATVLSFAALRDLALLCGFTRGLAPLLPIVIDAGAAAGSLVWLSGWASTPARRFARVLALVLLTSSVAANALGHGLAAYATRPHWVVVVLVSGVAPAVLGAVVHLAVLAASPGQATPAAGVVRETHEFDEINGGEGDAPYSGSGRASPADRSSDPGAEPPAGDELARAPADAGDDRETDRAGALIASGAGRRRLSRELGISEHEARKMLVANREDMRLEHPDQPAARTVPEDSKAAESAPHRALTPTLQPTGLPQMSGSRGWGSNPRPDGV